MSESSGALLEHLIEFDGAGSWPPVAATSDAWPAALVPYDLVAREVPERMCILCDDELPLDQSGQRKVIDAFRAWLAKCLQESVDLDAVMALLPSEGGASPSMGQATCNGFFGCLTYLRHAYRWGSVPILAAAQEEKALDMPAELDGPCAAFHNYYGLECHGGSMFSLVMLNAQKCRTNANGGAGEIAAGAKGACDAFGMTRTFCRGDPAKTESNFNVMMVEMEDRALPMYRAMAHVRDLCRRWKDGCDDDDDDERERIASSVSEALVEAKRGMVAHWKPFYSALAPSSVPQGHWIPYVQGPQAWGLYDDKGLTGAHSLSPAAIDAFLGMASSDSPSFVSVAESRRKHLTRAALAFIASLQDTQSALAPLVRWEAQTRRSDSAINKHYTDLYASMNLWRSHHRKKMQHYFEVNGARKERRLMTAGGGLVKEAYGVDTAQNMTDMFTDRLTERMQETTQMRAKQAAAAAVVTSM